MALEALSTAFIVETVASHYLRLLIVFDELMFQLFHAVLLYGLVPPYRFTFISLVPVGGGSAFTTTFTSSERLAPSSSVAVSLKTYVPSTRLLTTVVVSFGESKL